MLGLILLSFGKLGRFSGCTKYGAIKASMPKVVLFFLLVLWLFVTNKKATQIKGESGFILGVDRTDFKIEKAGITNPSADISSGKIASSRQTMKIPNENRNRRTK